jgi:hypothetical protein
MSHPYPAIQLVVRCLVAVGLVTLSLLVGLGSTQSFTYGDLHTSHPLMQGLTHWWLVAPPRIGGATWWPLVGRYPGALTNMNNSSFGWQAGQAGWYGDMRFLNGTPPMYIVLSTDPVFDLADRPMSIALRFRYTGTALAVLLAKRDFSVGDGWHIRGLSPSGIMQFRMASSTAGIDVNTVNAYNDNLWHSYVAVFRMDTATAANGIVTTYVDGLADPAAPGTATGVYSPCPTCEFRMGADHAGLSGMTGSLNDVRIYDRFLSAAEALAYHRQKPPDFDGMVVPAAVVVGRLPARHKATIE